MTQRKPLVGIIMGSRSDWDNMSHAAEILTMLDIPHECKVVSAHRTPERLYDYAKSAADRGLKVIIAGAGGARSEEHTSELQSLMRSSYAVFCLKKKPDRDSNNSTIL